MRQRADSCRRLPPCLHILNASSETTVVIPGTGIRRASKPPGGGTETTGIAKQRRGQGYFRDAVLNDHDNRCAITGMPVRELLIASHILPWSGHGRACARKPAEGGEAREKKTSKELRQDAELIRLIDDAIKSSMSEESDWAVLGPVGQHMLKQAPDFDSRNYGYAKLSSLVEAIGLYEVERKGNHPAIRRKAKQATP